MHNWKQRNDISNSSAKTFLIDDFRLVIAKNFSNRFNQKSKIINQKCKTTGRETGGLHEMLSC